jgi:hypothetical protein
MLVVDHCASDPLSRSVKGARASIVEMTAGSAEIAPRSFWFADAGVAVSELEKAFVSRSFSRLVIVAPSPIREELLDAMSSDLRAAVSKQGAVSVALELLPDEIEVRFRRLRGALPFVA